MIPKIFEQIDHADLAGLIANRVAERASLEFKRDLPGNAERARKEFLADISSFANAQGGDIIYGVEEHQGVAARLVGIESDNHDAVILRLEDQILAGIEPRISGLKLQWVKGPQHALLIRIPASAAAPHRVIYAGNGKFYGRKSNGKYEMDTHELRQAFTATEALTTKLRALHFEAVDAATQDGLPISLGDDPRAIISVIPVNIFRDRRDFDITPENAVAPIKPDGHMDSIHMLEGILLYAAPGIAGAVRSYAITHRAGRTDVVWTFGRVVNELKREEMRIVWPKRFEDGLFDAVLSTTARLQPLGVEGPWVVFTTLLGIKDYVLTLNEQYFSEPAWRDRVTFPELVSDTLNSETLLPVLRSFWLSFGVPRPAKPFPDENKMTATIQSR